MKVVHNQCGECSCEVTIYEDGMRQMPAMDPDAADPVAVDPCCDLPGQERGMRFCRLSAEQSEILAAMINRVGKKSFYYSDVRDTQRLIT